MSNSNYHDLNGEQENQLLQLVDKQGNIVGEATRWECHSGDGRTHLAFMAFITDEKNNMILTRRSGTKSLWKEYWDAAVVSHVLKGETVEEAANRRGKEELGVDVIFRDLGAFYYQEKFGQDSENEYCHVLVGKTSEEIIPNPVEIASVKKIAPSDFKSFYEREKSNFTPWFHISWRRFEKQITDGK